MGRKKKEIKLKEPVRIREKDLKDGNKSLYLDMYVKGTRKKESLKLYLIPEITATAKLQNENTRKLAEQIKAQRILDIQQKGLVNWETTKKSKTTLLGLMQRYVDAAEKQPSTKKARLCSMIRLKDYLNHINKPDLGLADVDKNFCKGFVEFLATCKVSRQNKLLSSTTCRLHANALSGALNMAVKEGLIDRNPYQLLDVKEKPKRAKVTKEYLTIDELKMLMKTPCRHEIIKQAFLFSCFTGLRYSDVVTLRWSEIHTAADGVTQYIEKVQIKTHNSVTIPLSAEALKWMPKRVEGKDVVFYAIECHPATVRDNVKEWVKNAGIAKHITFHSARHTAATTLLTLGANLYVVSKVLGHRSITTTEVYAKVVDAKKIETMNLVNDMFIDNNEKSTTEKNASTNKGEKTERRSKESLPRILRARVQKA